MRTSHFIRFSYRLATIVLVLVGLGWHTNPAQAQPVCQVRTLASAAAPVSPLISGNNVLWRNADYSNSLYSLETGETVIVGGAQFSGNYISEMLGPEDGWRVWLYDIAAKSETIVLQDFGTIPCPDGMRCTAYREAYHQLADPIILAYGLYGAPSWMPMDVVVYDTATETSTPLPASFVGWPHDLPLVTDGSTIVWAERETWSGPHHRVVRYDVASKTTKRISKDKNILKVALNDSYIAWLHVIGEDQAAIEVYDRRDGSIRRVTEGVTLSLPPWAGHYLTLTDDYVLWGKSGYGVMSNTMQVYDLRYNTTFTVVTNEEDTQLGSVPQAFGHHVVWDVIHYGTEDSSEFRDVIYYDLANRTQTTLNGMVSAVSSPSISSGGIVWAGEHGNLEEPDLVDINLAVCETNLTVNGTFEANDDGKVKLPNGWRGVGPLKGDHVLTDTLEETFAYSPPHAFQFKGFPGERSRIVSKADLRGHEMAKDDVLTLSGMVDQRSGVPGAQIVKATVRYTNGKQQIYRLRLPDMKTAGYIPLSVSKPLKFANVKKINLEVFYQKAKGKFIIDDVKLVLMKAEAIPALIPVPDAP